MIYNKKEEESNYNKIEDTQSKENILSTSKNLLSNDNNLCSETTSNTSSNYVCKFNSNCKKVFKSLQKYKIHQKSHILKKQIECTFEGCTKKFSAVNNLKVN